jgi:hypothetical protein
MGIDHSGKTIVNLNSYADDQKKALDNSWEPAEVPGFFSVLQAKCPAKPYAKVSYVCYLHL